MEENINKSYQILSLSGGGVRGLYTISVLAGLEEKLAQDTGRKDYNISEHFDLIAGTSIGGILAICLAAGYNARTLRNFLDSKRKLIFPQPTNVITNIFLLLVKYGNHLIIDVLLQKALEELLENKTVGDLNKKIIIPTINATTGNVQLYKTPHNPNLWKDKTVRLVDICLATSAAPTYFDPYLLDNSLKVDGGLVANSPALMAYFEGVNYLGWDSKKITILSIGTMGSKYCLAHKCNNTFKGWGYITGWGIGEKIIQLTMSSNENLHNAIIKNLIDEKFISIDSDSSPEQANDLKLDNSSDGVSEILKARADDTVKRIATSENVSKLFKHVAE